LSRAKKLGVYVQVPFCESKCSFCNFSSKVAPSSVFPQYHQALRREIQRLPRLSNEKQIQTDLLSIPVDTIYIGGGTPSLLGSEVLRQVVQSLRQTLRMGPIEEFSLEVTPGSADSDFLRAAREIGINRLSFGAQSFNDRELAPVGRLHSAGDTEGQVRLARRAGFRNISLDLIAGLPHQTKGSWRQTMDAALRLEAAHLSIYLFEVDEKSRLGREVLKEGSRYHAAQVPDDEFMAWAYEAGCRRLAAAGYRQYEISNFALPGFESLHNLKYWQLDPYIGLGAGAHSFDGVSRWANEVQVEEYARRLEADESPIADFRALSLDEQVEEFFFLGLRRREGIELDEARERWGAGPLKPCEKTIAALLQDGWLEQAGSRVRLAPRALLVSNEIFQEFIAA
jgi:oxygen-independent coproporphyrinogen-3 oxidase